LHVGSIASLFKLELELQHHSGYLIARQHSPPHPALIRIST
jgi:hypothetical protein